MIISIIILLLSIVFAIFNYSNLGANPKGARLERIKKSPNYRDGQFQNLHETPMNPSGKSFYKIALSFITEKKNPNRIPIDSVPAVQTDLTQLDLSKNQIVWFGHSSYLLVLDGKRILVDPVFSSSFPGSLMMKPFKGTNIYSPNDMPNIDILIITHDHYDHLDYKTVKQIKNRVSKVVCPLGVGAHFEKWGYLSDCIEELDWYEKTMVEGLTVNCTPTRHFSGRFIKRNPTLWASFVLESKKDTIFIGGDGGYDDFYKKIGEKFNIDLAIIENGQYDENWCYIHTMPQYLQQLIHDLKPKKVMGVHNSKFSLSRHAWKEPIDNLNNMAKRDSSFQLISSQIGEITIL